MGHRVFKAKKKVREVSNEEESIENWRMRKNKKNSYINPNKNKVYKVFEKLKNSNLEISRIRIPLVIHEESIPRPKRVKLKESLPVKAKEIEIITDLDIIALGTIDIILPPFNQLSLLGQINNCNILELPVVNQISCKINCASSRSRKDIHLNQLVPSLTFNIPGDGNCLFSTLSYIITGSTSYSYKMRKIITDNIMGKLRQICLKFIQNKFPLTYRNTREYISSQKCIWTKSGVETLNYFRWLY